MKPTGRQWFVRACALTLLLGTSGVFMAPAALAQAEPQGETSVGDSGLVLPRFVSLAVDKAYMRSGPGSQYPIQWVYRRDMLPLMITAEFGAWRRVRDREGTEGWMHARLLSGQRTALITGGTRDLYRRPHRQSDVVVRAEPGVVAEILGCQETGWCRLKLEGRKGWLPQDHFWGSFEREVFK